jgi:pterin-4a-carbinolamine dehydratase
MPKPLFLSSFVRAQNASWTPRNACIINQILFLDELHLLSPDMFFDAQAVHFTSTTKYVDPVSHKDAMSRPDAKEWKEAFDKEMNGLKKRNVFSVVDRPSDRNPLGTTMVYKYKYSKDNNVTVRKCRLCVRGDLQREGVDYFKYKTYSAVLNSRENRVLCALAASTGWSVHQTDITQAFTYGELDPGVEIYCYIPDGFPSVSSNKVLKLELAFAAVIRGWV